MNNLLLPKDPQGRYILRLDSSALRKSNCLRHVWFNVFRGLTPNKSSEAADYGTAAHKFMQAWYGGGTITLPNALPKDETDLLVRRNFELKDQFCSLGIAQEWFRANVTPSEGSWRTLAHLTALLNGYVKEYGEADGLVASEGWLEKKFEILWYEDEQVVVYLCGTIDLKGTYHGEPVICDHKTHSPYGFGTLEAKALKYLAGYQFSVQGKVYHLAVKRLIGEDCGFMINGLFLEKSGKNLFRRSEIFRWSKAEESFFERWLTRRITEIVFDFKNSGKFEDFLPNFTCCLSDGWPCDYAPICGIGEELREELIMQDFKASLRDPRNFGKD